MFNVIPPQLQKSFCYLKLLTGVALLQKIQVQQKCFVFDLFCKVKFVNFRNLASLLIFIHSTYTVCCFYVVSHFGIDSLWSLPRLSDTNRHLGDNYCGRLCNINLFETSVLWTMVGCFVCKHNCVTYNMLQHLHFVYCIDAPFLRA